MASSRKLVFASGEIYHIFNRGVERRPIFTDKYGYRHFLDVTNYYRFNDLALRFSKFEQLPESDRRSLFSEIVATNQLKVDILAFCLMPNHFHFLLKQIVDGGISSFVSCICNSHSKYFNIKNSRVGPLFQGPFKAVRVETEDQLIHLSRYIHINPTSSFLIKEHELDTYPWSSFPEYLNKDRIGISNPKPVVSLFKSPEDYQLFVHNQIDYAQKLERIKHLSLDVEE